MTNIEKYDSIMIEKNVLGFWKEQNIYQKAKELTAKGKDYYFLDGPPYTSGRIHLGTAWNKTLKDCVLRYKRMTGLNVWDRAGYDMHGLPTETATQKKLNLPTKDDIQKFGVPRFIEECKKLCLENMKLMNEDFQRLGVWMNFENAYQSITKDFMEGEWWLIKKAHDNGRLYEGLRTMHWCPITESALAKHELEYKNVKDDSIFVKFKIKGKENEYLIIWTTTPWTIPFNLAVMVNPELDYVKAKVDNEIWYVASVLANVFISSVADKKFEIIEEMKGDKLEGIEYEHPLYTEFKEDYDRIKKEAPKTHTVLLSTEYVDASAGTGLVHCAPGCGPEDFEVGYKNGIPPFNSLTTNGTFPEGSGKFTGLVAKNDDKKFTEALNEIGALIASTQVEHEYPHDWRNHKPVIFRTTKQWFLKVEDMKDDMIKKNQGIHWVPKAAFNAFDSWLKNLRDNSISKQRYWGTPLPIWRNVDDENDYIVIGSAKELEELSGQKVDDLHISTVDNIEINKGDKTYRRIPDVLDVWVDAGTTSWTCLDYPQKTEMFDRLYPPEFILEGKDQIRGWFNLLFVASMVSMKKIAYKACYMHGFVNDALGRKMSKSLGNIISPFEVIDKYGADVFRYYSIGGANPGLDLNYNLDDMIVKHRHLSVLWNLHKFLVDYTKQLGVNIDFKKLDEKNISIEEVYITSKLHSTIKHVTDKFEKYEINETPLLVEELFLELSRTYIQLVREKSALGSEEEKKIVLHTIFKVLYDTLRIFAPIAPIITEKIYQNMKEAFELEHESIHLAGWPKADESKIDKELEHAFEHAKAAIQAILAGREKASLGVRWPIKEAVVVTKDKKVKRALMDLKDIIKTQTNVKDLDVVDSFDRVKETIKTDYAKLGPDFGKLTPKIIAHLMNESPYAILEHLEKDGKFTFKVDNQKVDIVKEHIIVEHEVEKPYEETKFRSGAVYLNTELDKDLLAEGYSRELMRRVQSLRKKQGLQKTDSIELFVKCEKELIEIFRYHEQQINEKVGAASIAFTDVDVPDKFAAKSAEKIRGKAVEIFFNKLE